MRRQVDLIVDGTGEARRLPNETSLPPVGSLIKIRAMDDAARQWGIRDLEWVEVIAVQLDYQYRGQKPTEMVYIIAKPLENPCQDSGN